MTFPFCAYFSDEQRPYMDILLLENCLRNPIKIYLENEVDRNDIENSPRRVGESFYSKFYKHIKSISIQRNFSNFETQINSELLADIHDVYRDFSTFDKQRKINIFEISDE